MDVCERFPQSHSFSTNVGTRHEFAVDVASVQAELFASHAKNAHLEAVDLFMTSIVSQDRKSSNHERYNFSGQMFHLSFKGINSRFWKISWLFRKDEQDITQLLS
ncbi:hypothetical protein Csa_021189 [Cucumis sativus]|uniref:Uncharacterized protein n=1 Tax=Cucumis sativus TaxID=3659 RepID=A0A0A0LK22_CUCSA|nr:hypothetical protein Csa_021189 [Cucumis sativus]